MRLRLCSSKYTKLKKGTFFPLSSPPDLLLLTMGLCRSVFNALLGPFLIYLVLMGHVGYRMFVEEPEPLSVQDFPKGTAKEARDAVVSGRKALIKDFMDAFAGKPK